jgi:hypothetical protein
VSPSAYTVDPPVQFAVLVSQLPLVTAQNRFCPYIVVTPKAMARNEMWRLSERIQRVGMERFNFIFDFMLRYWVYVDEKLFHVVSSDDILSMSLTRFRFDNVCTRHNSWMFGKFITNRKTVYILQSGEGSLPHRGIVRDAATGRTHWSAPD